MNQAGSSSEESGGRWFRAHGILWCADLDLNAQGVPAPSPQDSVDTVRVHFAASVPPAGPSDSLLLERPVSRWDTDIVTLHRIDGGGYLFAFGEFRFWIDAELTQVKCLDVPGDERVDAQVLIEGWVAAILVWLRGDPVLHASAVLLDDGLTVFVGASGQGKSTLAATLCADGGLLVTDDVLRVGLPVGGGQLAYVGTTGLRLRPSASEQSALTRTGPTHRVFDRLVVRPDQAIVEGPFPIRRIVIPEVVKNSDTDCQTDSGFRALTRLSIADAVMALLSYPRVFVWRHPDLLGTEFDRVVTIAREVPVYRGWVDRGPMNSHRLRQQLESLDSGAP